MISVQNAAAGLVATLSIVMVNSVARQTIEPRKLMGTINEESSWSPDGKKISFDHAAQGECDIFTIDTPQK
jgi:Tol biopolymer transport system component